MSSKVPIKKLETGVPGLDEILGGGLPEFSCNLIAGEPGSGKTTLAHQLMFSLASPDNPALFFTIVGEPPIKMLRYQQQYSFFDADLVDEAIHFINLSEDLAKGGLEKVLARIIREVKSRNPALVFVDSFRSVARAADRMGDGDLMLQSFVQQIAITLTGWEATTFLIGEYSSSDVENNPVLTVADGVLWLEQSVDRNSMVRKIQVMKMRGQAPSPGLHTFRITDNGIEIFPRVIMGPREKDSGKRSERKRMSMGNNKLDEMLGGGLPSGFSLLVVGPSGSGKSVLATEFIMAGVRGGERGVIALFEKNPSEYLQGGTGGSDAGKALGAMIRKNQVGIVHNRPLDLSLDETLHDIIEELRRIKGTRLMIDSLSGFELALAPTFREEFRESLYRLVAVLTGMGITIVMTAELEDSYVDLRFSPHGTAFLTDAIIMQRYIESQGRLERIISVVKLRGSAHSKDLHAFDITDQGLVIGKKLANYDGLLSGRPDLVQPATRARKPQKKR